MALVYTPPGINFSEIVSSTVSPLLSAPAQPCIIAPAQGYIVRTDQIILSGTTPQPLPNLPAGGTVQAVTSVIDASDPTKGANDGSGYVLTTDYTVNLSNGTITRVSSGAIADGRLVNVTYRYVSSQYFTPIRLDSLSAIEQRFGSSYTADGTNIGSLLSFAASIAFENGAPSVICQPLFVRATPGDPTTAAQQPNATQVASASSWSDTLFGLRDYEDINLIVPAIGQSWNSNALTDNNQLGILSACQDHTVWMKTQNSYIITVAGEDSTSGSAASETTLQSHASNLASRYGGSFAEQFVLVSPASYQRILPLTGKPLNVGGQYVAAAIAGLLSSFSTFTPLTRTQISGFSAVNETRNVAQKNADASSGLLVVEQSGAAVQIRHAVTLDTSTAARRELSVVRSKHRMIESVRQTLDTQIIGQITADANAPFIVATAVIGTLEQLKQLGELVDYSDVATNIVSLDPTTIQVRFSYLPSFPVNYINIVFSLDLSGTGATTDTNPNQTSA